jgi:tRNA-dihydrouridine synthase
MVGRGALGNPWIFNEINMYLKDGTIVKKPTMEEIKKMMIEHLESLINLKGEHVALLEMRSHGPWYLKGIPNASTLRKQLSQTQTKKEFIEHIEAFF